MCSGSADCGPFYDYYWMGESAEVRRVGDHSTLHLLCQFCHRSHTMTSASELVSDFGRDPQK
jgi:hypothetical protein